MHYGLVAPALHGHLNPISTLGQELASRGHRVTLLSSQRARPFAERAGIEWAPLCDVPEIAEGWDQLGEMSGLAAMRFTGKLLKRSMELTYAELGPVVREQQLDALVIDQLAPSAAAVAEEQGLPYAVACNAIAIHLCPEIPPPPLDWAYRCDAWGRIRNRFGNWLCRTLFVRLSAASTASGIDPTMLADINSQHGVAILSQQPACFDFPNHPRPAHFHYTAPWHTAGRDRDVPFPWEKLDDTRPLVYASLGTLQNKLKHVYAAIAESTRGLDMQMVLSLGSADAKLGVAPPENVIVVPFAPQLQLLDRASAVVTHAGLNTTLESLSRGLPMLCLPITNDQPGVASRVQYLGAGQMLPIARANADRVRRALEQLLADDSYRQAAERLQSQFAGENGPAMAVDIIEREVAAFAQPK
ncbi:glycosyltransferase [Aeoliella sp.]|uniref:glycosyltransferase n=1 Tax=Aeoliella sp. TaxID=2795800 RepID=UPI003CCB960E